jgi:hypothetical protein
VGSRIEGVRGGGCVYLITLSAGPLLLHSYTARRLPSGASHAGSALALSTGTPSADRASGRHSHSWREFLYMYLVE